MVESPGIAIGAEGGQVESRARRAVRLAIDGAGEPDGAERDRGARDDLVGPRADGDEREDAGEHHPRHDRQRDARPGAGRRGAERRGQRAGEHHPLEPEVHHAGALGDRLAGRGEHERRRHPHRGGQESAEATIPSASAPAP